MATQGSYNYKMFKCFNRKFKVTEVEPPAEVRAAFTRFSIGRSTMTADQFRLFLIEHQGQDGSSAAEDAERTVKEALLQRREKDGSSPGGEGGEGICLDEFFRFLLSCDLNGPIHRKVKCRSLCCSFVSADDWVKIIRRVPL